MDGTLVCFNKSKNEISYASAHSAPALVNGKLQEMATDAMPVGMGEKKDSFTHQTITLESNNILYLYTDGFADQFGGPKGKKFKKKKLNELLASISILPMEDQKKILDQSFKEWQGDLEQVDDLLIIGIKL